MQTPWRHPVEPSFLTLTCDYRIKPLLCLAEPTERLVPAISRKHEVACILAAFADQDCKSRRDWNDVLGLGFDAVSGNRQRGLAYASLLDLGPLEVRNFSKAAP